MTIALKNMLFDGVVAGLNTALITNVPEADPTRATLVRAGKLQKDPTTGTGINVLVWTSEDDDTLYTSQAGLKSPVYEIGGGAFYMLKFQLELVFHYKGLRGDDGRSESRESAHVILSRIRYALQTMPIPTHPTTGLVADDFGETAIEIEISKMNLKEGGGDGHFIWRGTLDFGYLTQTPTRFN